MIDRAIAERLPVVVFCALRRRPACRRASSRSCRWRKCPAPWSVWGGGPSALHHRAHRPPTGGVTASFAMLGRYRLSRARALIGFAGQRVIRDTIKQELPEGFQTAEFALEHGLVDAIVERSQMRSVLAQLLALHAPADDPGRIVTYHSVMDALSVGADAYGSVDVAPEARAVGERIRDEEAAGLWRSLAESVPVVGELIGRPETP